MEIHTGIEIRCLCAFPEDGCFPGLYQRQNSLCHWCQLVAILLTEKILDKLNFVDRTQACIRIQAILFG